MDIPVAKGEIPKIVSLSYYILGISDGKIKFCIIDDLIELQWENLST